MFTESSPERGTELTITREREGAVGVILLHRGHRKNAISGDQADRIVGALAELEADPKVRCIVIGSAAGHPFGAGLDVRELADSDAAGRARQQASMLALQSSMARCVKPVIAAVEQLALGASLQLALHTDLLVMAESAQLGMPELAAGQPCIIGSWLLSRRLTPQEVADVVLLGRRVGAFDALRLGLAARSAPDGATLEVAADLAESLVGLRSAALETTLGWLRRLRYGASIDYETALADAADILGSVNGIARTDLRA